MLTERKSSFKTSPEEHMCPLLLNIEQRNNFPNVELKAQDRYIGD